MIVALKEEINVHMETITSLQSSPNDGGDCTGLHDDPNSSKPEVPCCAGLKKALNNWDGRWYYRCENPCWDVVCDEKEVLFTKVENHTKYACGKATYEHERNTLVCYPRTGKYTPKTHLPVVFYNRDSNGWLDPNKTYPNESWKNKIDPGNRKWLKTMAEQCLITIAPMTQEKGNKKGTIDHDLCNQNHDSLLAYEFLKNKTDPGWEKWGITSDVKPDWNRIAAAGLSAGGHHTPSLQMLFGQEHDIKMKAVLIGHGGSKDKKEALPGKYKSDLVRCLKKGNGKWCDDVPALFLTATDDTTVNYTHTENWYKILTGQKTPNSRAHVQNAVYAQVKTGNHLEPTDPARGIFNDYSARFLACHLYKDEKKIPEVSKEACAWIYGGLGKKNICNSAEVKALALDTVHLFYNGNEICY